MIGSWKKGIGDAISVGDVLFSYETDKAVFECESTAEGTLLEIFHNDGDEVPVLTPVCAVGAPGEAVVYEAAGGAGPRGAPAAPAIPNTPAAPAAPTGSAIAAVPAASGSPAIPAAPVMPAGSAASPDIKISPRAKNLARRLGVDYALAVPSGPHGRIIERDIAPLAGSRQAGPAIQGALAGAPPEVSGMPANADVAAAYTGASDVAFTDDKMPKIRRVIAGMMLKSLSEIAQLTHHHSFDATRLLALREDFKRRGANYGLDGVTIGDVINFVVTRVLTEHPDLNAHLLPDDVLRRFQGVNLGVAISTERGLLVPTVFGADGKSLKELSAEVKALADSARSGAISPDRLGGATFTVSNLGATGVEMFTPIINPPQVAILGICGITTRARVSPGGGLEAYRSIGLSLTYDHRAVDGAPASVFVKKLCENLEHIDLLLINEKA